MRANLGFGRTGLLVRLSVFLGLVIAAILSGLYLGKVSVNDEGAPVVRSERTPSPVAREGEGGMESSATTVASNEPPLFVHIGHSGDGHWKVAEDLIALAAKAELHQYIVPLSLQWPLAEAEHLRGQYSATLERYHAVDPRARFLLFVDLNPTTSWLENHGEAAMRIRDTYHGYPSLASTVWRETAIKALSECIAEIENGPFKDHVMGYALGALLEKRWLLPPEHDTSDANRRAFADWLRQRYKTDTALQAAWGQPDATFDTLRIPDAPVEEDASPVFLPLPQGRPVVDFARFSSEQVADTLASFYAHIARTSSVEPQLLAPYGFTFETMSGASGHFALELLLGSDLDGIIAPVSYTDRGLGGVGGIMGPVDSLTVRGKSWIIMDDTRTGVERDESTGSFLRIKGIRAEDVYEVQRRNFSMSLIFGLGLAWSDPQAEGWLNDAEQWNQFKQLKHVHQSYHEQPREMQGEATLTLVVDETSRFYQHCDTRVNIPLLQRARDAALRIGVRTRFHLLRDIVEDIAPPTPVYLFLNAFQLDEEDRVRLHSRLAREEACAIWLYAPGYIADTADADNIGTTTGMDVRAFDDAAHTGSRYLLTGQYMQAEQAFGSGELWSPLFYIAPEENTDFLAHYDADKDKGSVAILTLPEGWTSVYIAEPEITPALLGEILRLLEQPLINNPVERPFYDTLFARDDLIMLHASQPGKRTLSLEQFQDIRDLFDPSIGWFQKDGIMLSVRTGETRLLQQKDIEGAVSP